MKSLSIIILSLIMLSGCAFYNPDGSWGGHSTTEHANFPEKLDSTDAAFMTIAVAGVVRNNPDLKPAMSGVLGRVIDYAEDADNVSIADIDGKVENEIAESDFTVDEKTMARALYIIAKDRVETYVQVYDGYKWTIPKGAPDKLLIDALRVVKSVVDAKE